jgi:signal transduction histidine kinase/ActR/RegA family two-component response regulator
MVLIAVALLPLAALSGVGLFALARYQDEQAQQVGIELAVSVANSVGTELRSVITILQTLSTAPSLDRNDGVAFRERAIRIVSVQPDWEALILTDPEGGSTLDTRVDAGGASLPVVDTESLRRVIDRREPAVGRLVNHQGRWVFPVRVPVMREGALRQVLTALVRPSAIHDVIARQHIPSDWIISIVDAQGVRVARSRAHEENLGGRLSDSAQTVLAAGGDRGTGVSTTLEGVEIVTPYSSIAPFGWQAVLGIPTASMAAAAWRSSLVMGGGFLLSILLGALGAGWVARGITAPIRRLRDAADQLARRQVPEPIDAGLSDVRDVAEALTNAGRELARYEAEREDLLAKERGARDVAERAGRAKDEFMAILSHELRTPLNAVFGWARLLQAKHLKEEAQVDKAVEAIVRNADAQVRLIDDLLDLSRVSSGKMQLAAEPVRLVDVRQGALDAIRPLADEKGVRITVIADDQSADTILGDAARLQQAILNLLTNAVKFTDSGGEVLLRQHFVDGQVEIAVSDTGHGIAPDMLPHVFDRFRQGDSSSTRSHRGLGLGLALVKELVALHGGTVTADSMGVGLGATFTIRLPRSAAPVAVAVSGSLDDSALRSIVRLDGLRIVVTDDDPDALTLTATILSAAGADVRPSPSAAQAIELVQQCKPHVLLSDLEMPGEDGYALIAKVRTLPPSDGGLTPAIALSAYGRPQDRDRALTAGFSMHVPKPVDPGELTAIVADLALSPLSPRDRAAPDHGKMPSSL